MSVTRDSVSSWPEDRAPDLVESRTRRLSVMAALSLPMMLFVGFAIVAVLFLRDEDRVASAAQASTDGAARLLRATNPSDALFYESASVEAGVQRLKDEVVHVSTMLQSVPGDNVRARFDGVANDYLKARDSLAAEDRLGTGTAPVSDAVTELLDFARRSGDTSIGQPGGLQCDTSACDCTGADVVYFAIGSHGLTPLSRQLIGCIAERWRTTARQPVLVEGFADNKTGTPDGNRKLAAARAKTVADYLRTLIGPPNVHDMGRDGSQAPHYAGAASEDPEHWRVAVLHVRQ